MIWTCPRSSDLGNKGKAADYLNVLNPTYAFFFTYGMGIFQNAQIY